MMPDTTGSGYITIRLPYEDWVEIKYGIQEWANRDPEDIEIRQ